MRKNFRLIAAIAIMAIVNFGTFAQTKTHKDVILDGKPAKLDLKTGEVKKLNKKALKGKHTDQDSTKLKTEIQANLITNTSQTKASNSENVIVTSKPDTLAQHYKKLLLKEDEIRYDLVTNANDTTSVKDEIINDVILITPENTKELTGVSEQPTSKSHELNKTYSGNSGNFHVVQKGETLYGLARLYDTTLGDLKRANGLETTLIKIGQKLQVRQFDNSFNSGVWIVSKGDTLYSIAKKNNTTVASIKTLNGLTGDLIFPGQELQL